MEPSSHEQNSTEKKKKKKNNRPSDSNTSIQSLPHELLLKIFSNLHHSILIRCSSVCKFWYDCIDESTILQKKYDMQKLDYPELFAARRSSSSGTTTLKSLLNELAMQQHRMSFENESVRIFQWEGHSSRVDQCRMKMGRILTGVGDKVVRVWSLESYKCLEEYSVPGTLTLADMDFDESKVVGLVGSRICIWRRDGKISIFPSPYETVASGGLCMRYIDPEAVVGCGDGAARVYDMYSKKCTHIIRMHDGPVTCLALTDDHLILSGSSLGSIKFADLSSDQRVSSLRPTTNTSTGITTLCYNSSSSLVFAGSTAGYLHCWDLRTMKQLWENRVSPNMIYSVQHMQNDTSSVVTGGIDGVLRIVNQGTGELISRYVIGEGRMKLGENGNGVVERIKGRMISKEESLDSIPKYRRPAITCLAVGMQKVITTHNSKVIRVWKFAK